MQMCEPQYEESEESLLKFCSWLHKVNVIVKAIFHVCINDTHTITIYLRKTLRGLQVGQNSSFPQSVYKLSL